MGPSANFVYPFYLGRSDSLLETVCIPVYRESLVLYVQGSSAFEAEPHEKMLAALYIIIFFGARLHMIGETEIKICK